MKEIEYVWFHSIAVRCRPRVFLNEEAEKKGEEMAWVGGFGGTTAASYEPLTNKEGRQRLQLWKSQDDARIASQFSHERIPPDHRNGRTSWLAPAWLRPGSFGLEMILVHPISTGENPVSFPLRLFSRSRAKWKPVTSLSTRRVRNNNPWGLRESQYIWRKASLFFKQAFKLK